VKLLIDIGNTRLKWGVSDNAELRCVGALFLSELDRLDEVLMPALGAEATNVGEVHVACVASPDVLSLVCEWSRRVLGLVPRVAKVQGVQAGLRVAYRDLSHLGVDRWLSMLAVWTQMRQASVVICAGSAITVDVIDDSGRHCGGLIVPGIHMMGAALTANTSAIKIASLTLPQKWRLGCDTLPCIENGVAAMLSGMLDSVWASVPGHAQVFVAGGDADAVMALLPVSGEKRENLVMEGLTGL